MKKLLENLSLWMGIIILVTLLFGQVALNFGFGVRNEKIQFSEFLDLVEKGEVQKIVIEGYDISGVLKSGTRFYTKATQYTELIPLLRKNNVDFQVASGDSFLGLLFNILISWFPMLLLIGVWIFFMKQMQAGGNKTMTFGKSKARLLSDRSNKVTFHDVAGIDEAKEELAEIVEFLREPKKFQKLGGKIPKGCLLIGPPGTGKTLLAKAIAGEAKVPFFSISGSDFVEMFVGVGASRVRDMFEQGKKNAPCLIFIDEIDAVGRHRGVGFGGGNDEREQTLNQLLVEMDGFEANEGVIIIAATNRPDVLDPALLRPGRFDRQITISIPDIAGRQKILEVHLKKIPTAPNVEVSIIARGTPGFSGADLANLVNESALIAARRNKKVVTNEDFEYARDKILMGMERKSLVMREEEKLLTAYHEAGHAVTSLKLEASDPIHKATIIPRGRALGLVMRLPEHDRVSFTRAKMHADLIVAMGGRAAEQVIFGDDKTTSGAASDIKQATHLARSMVTKWGMSEKVGPLLYGEQNDPNNHILSIEMSNLIDSEVKQLITDALKEATKILNENIESLHRIAKALLEYETLTGQELSDLLEGKPFLKKTTDDKKVVSKSSLDVEDDTVDKETLEKLESDLDTGDKE
ncbi:ATP-dependent zinc metalloprotease FtsH [Neorickettsia risticii]